MSNNVNYSQDYILLLLQQVQVVLERLMLGFTIQQHDCWLQCDSEPGLSFVGSHHSFHNLVEIWNTSIFQFGMDQISTDCHFKGSWCEKNLISMLQLRNWSDTLTFSSNKSFNIRWRAGRLDFGSQLPIAGAIPSDITVKRVNIN